MLQLNTSPAGQTKYITYLCQQIYLLLVLQFCSQWDKYQKEQLEIDHKQWDK